MTADAAISKEEEEEEDDTMQNTVVLFSNTDKFVLLQVLLSYSVTLQLSRSASRITAVIAEYASFFHSLSLFQDMCVVCGSFGKGAEGQLLACAQCAQCYHPYCVNSKVSTFNLCQSVFCDSRHNNHPEKKNNFIVEF